MAPGTKVALTSIAAWYAGKWVGTTDWYAKEVADAKAKDPNAGPPLTAMAAQAGAAAAVGYLGYRFFVKEKKEG